MGPDIESPKLLYAKAILFVVAGLFAALLVLLRDPSLEVAALLAVSIWSFARAYYFAFYVLERYVDPSFRFAGLGSLVRHVVRTRSTGASASQSEARASRPEEEPPSR